MAACTQREAFNKEKWAIVEDGIYPYRNPMVSDLISRYKLENVSYVELTSLLGTPQSSEVNKVFYQVDIEYKMLSVDPCYIKNLEISLYGDSTVQSFELKEHHLP